jgi:Uma2 family endonuclease
MSVIIDAGRIASLPRHRLTVEDFHRMVEAGILGEDVRVELIEGELIDMPPVGSKHAGTVTRLSRMLTLAVSGKAIVYAQNPVVFRQYSEPQPDIALLKPRADDYTGALPVSEDVLLLVEVAESSLSYDREVKVPLYAHYGIPELWLIDLQHERVEIYREPGTGGYRTTVRPENSECISPSLLPGVSVCLPDLWR